MPRFSVAFSKRKPAADEFENVPIAASEQPSFRVIERHHEARGGRSFDGGARMAARVSRVGVPKPGSTNTNGHLLDLNADDNMFADVKANRGSGVSNTTQATSTDNSSRHSNASTAPSSTDLGGGGGGGSGHEDTRPATKYPQPEPPSRGTSSTKSSFLDRATRTFSFGGQKKHSIPPPQDNARVPDLPPVLTLQSGGGGTNIGESRSRGMTASTVSTATPTNAGNNNGLDLGSDFSSMFTKFDKRASSSTLKNDEATVETRCLTGSRPVQPVPPSPDRIATSAAEPLLGSQKSPGLDEPALDLPPVARHQNKAPLKYSSSRSPTTVEDQDAKLLRESFAAAKFLSEAKAPRYRRDDAMFMPASPPQNFAISPLEDNMFEGSLPPRAVRVSQRPNGRTMSQPQNKVMTPAEFEQYRQQHGRQKSTDGGASDAAAKDISHDDDDDDDEDEINYDDDYDEQEKSKQQAKQRRKQEAHMAVYRQQMMKVTGETSGGATPRPRPSIVLSSSAPQLSQIKAPSPDPAMNDDDDEDDDVPLGILQAHGFPHKSRPPTMLNATGSMSNLRPASAMGDGAGGAGRRMSTLPAFARNLPQDPFVGASIARPALRESLSFGDAALFAQQQQQQQQQQQAAPPTPGGLVGVIANEERSRALRRGSPNMDSHKMAMNGALGLDGMAGIPHHMLYSAAPPPPPQQPVLTPGDQAQIQMTQQMQQFMQMQMQLMQMMAVQHNGGSGGVAGQPQPHMHMAPTGAFPVSDVSLQSRAMSPAGDGRMRTMSMVQPSSVSNSQLPAPSVRASVYPAYAPSMAPSERSNVGLPGRYRPVSQSPAPPPPPPPHASHYRASTMSGGLSAWADGVKTKSTIKLVAKGRGLDNDDDDDDETGWEAMRAKRDMKRSLWRGKKSFGARELAL
ncbi:hypothetical protein CDD82_463 [Ophiocordyceps australis]|uniref:Uncharacterized protein n=1 Tax=Ophiocordyceps australis TaxID=1399860 RepID=A0A2C5YNS9_9HYPO|nr:hypothetical protein CDD82_463 [Ophiocordyceps australis]